MNREVSGFLANLSCAFLEDGLQVCFFQEDGVENQDQGAHNSSYIFGPARPKCACVIKVQAMGEMKGLMKTNAEKNAIVIPRVSLPKRSEKAPPNDRMWTLGMSASTPLIETSLKRPLSRVIYTKQTPPQKTDTISASANPSP